MHEVDPRPGDITVIEDGVTATKAQDFTLDVAGRLSVTKNLTGTVSLVETTNHYDGSDDSPAWTETKTRPDAATGWATAWNRNVETSVVVPGRWSVDPTVISTIEQGGR